ncbi:hypothetical protein [Caballeronia eucalypticola]
MRKTNVSDAGLRAAAQRCARDHVPVAVQRLIDVSRESPRVCEAQRI